MNPSINCLLEVSGASEGRSWREKDKGYRYNGLLLDSSGRVTIVPEALETSAQDEMKRSIQIIQNALKGLRFAGLQFL
ncbi:hypothetical protein H0E87_007376 [Populus deltoides]|uniref:Uncharacterized protein n=1 Tax=Populus deltoides TaxID=3696 RepID=A0A8T2ZAY5_POPDE|nr:hypothetical protein H0E87_007376 [Populus deltoides]